MCGPFLVIHTRPLPVTQTSSALPAVPSARGLLSNEPGVANGPPPPPLTSCPLPTSVPASFLPTCPAWRRCARWQAPPTSHPPCLPPPASPFSLPKCSCPPTCPAWRRCACWQARAALRLASSCAAQTSAAGERAVIAAAGAAAAASPAAAAVVGRRRPPGSNASTFPPACCRRDLVLCRQQGQHLAVEIVGVQRLRGRAATAAAASPSAAPTPAPALHALHDGSAAPAGQHTPAPAAGDAGGGVGEGKQSSAAEAAASPAARTPEHHGEPPLKRCKLAHGGDGGGGSGGRTQFPSGSLEQLSAGYQEQLIIKPLGVVPGAFSCNCCTARGGWRSLQGARLFIVPGVQGGLAFPKAAFCYCCSGAACPPPALRTHRPCFPLCAPATVLCLAQAFALASNAPALPPPPTHTTAGCVEIEVQRGSVLSPPLPLLALPCAAAVAEVLQLAAPGGSAGAPASAVLCVRVRGARSGPRTLLHACIRCSSGSGAAAACASRPQLCSRP